MKILLIIPPSPDKRKIIRWVDCCQEAKAGYLWQPNDYLIITSLLKPEDAVVFIDGTADSLSEKDFFERISGLKGDIIFFSMATVCWESDFYYFKKTKDILSGIPIFTVGDAVVESHYRVLMLKECNGLLASPYFLNLEKMADCNQRELPGICTDPDQKIYPDGKKVTYLHTNSPRHEIFLKHRYRFPFARRFKFSQVTTMWGCPFSCAYCADSRIPPVARYYRDILIELESIVRLGVKELYFADKTFGFSKDNALSLLREMSKRFNFSWSTYFSPQLYNPSLLELMSSAGCHTIIIGIDTYNTDLLKEHNRYIKRNQIEDTIKHANKLNIKICADFILGFENETEEDVMETINYALRLPIDFSSFNIAAPFPGSNFREEAIKRGYHDADLEGFDSVGRRGHLGNKYLGGKDLERLRAKAIRSFYFRPSYLMQRLREVSSLEHFLIQFDNMISLLRKS